MEASASRLVIVLSLLIFEVAEVSKLVSFFTSESICLATRVMSAVVEVLETDPVRILMFAVTVNTLA